MGGKCRPAAACLRAVDPPPVIARHRNPAGWETLNVSGCKSERERATRVALVSLVQHVHTTRSSFVIRHSWYVIRRSCEPLVLATTSFVPYPVPPLHQRRTLSRTSHLPTVIHEHRTTVCFVDHPQEPLSPLPFTSTSSQPSYF